MAAKYNLTVDSLKPRRRQRLSERFQDSCRDSW